VIGNDIVDLDDEETREGSQHRRFDERVFHARELALVRASHDPHRLRWLLWAAKESAFKMLRRAQPALVFSPPRFVVCPAARGAATVEAGGSIVPVRYELGAGYVHCIAGCEGGPVIAAVDGVDRVNGTPGDASAAVRRLASQSIARVLRVDARELVVGRVGRLPVVFCRGRPLSGTLSLSHHGRFVAFAWRGGVQPSGQTVLTPRDLRSARNRSASSGEIMIDRASE
jgi:phosphopantetheinyl transferase (holo-ACP synthase)